MLTGTDLGAAIDAAIKLKGVQKSDVADHFKIKPPSIQDWVKRGTIGKDKLPALWKYFSDVVGPEHWGLESFPMDANVRPATSGKRPYPVISLIQAGAVKEISDPYSPGDGYDIEYGDDEWSAWTFALEIDGKSMEPDFRQGDRVLIDPQIAPRPGDFVAAKNNLHQATFKKYRVRGIDTTGKEVFELVPMNPDFETLRSDAQQLLIIGVMVEHRRKYRR